MQMDSLPQRAWINLKVQDEGVPTLCAKRFNYLFYSADPFDNESICISMTYHLGFEPRHCQVRRHLKNLCLLGFYL